MSALAGRGYRPSHHQHHHHHATHSAARTTPRYGFSAVRPAVLAAARLLALPLASAAPLSLFDRALHSFEDDDTPTDAGDPSLWIYLSIALVLVLLGGVFAGLTIALMGQDETYLQVIATSGEGAEKKHAAKVLNLLNKGKHWVLVTLLLSNVITNETLPIVLDRSLGGGWPAVVSSTVLIVIFGEIAPQSVCVRFGLSIGAYMAPFVLGLMWLMCPIAWPTAKLLDWLLGEDHGVMYKKAGLKTLVTLHKTLGAGAGEQLMEDEVTIINSVLDLKDKPVGDIMTPMQDVFTMSADTVLDEKMMDIILSQGYSRIPIYAPENRRNFIGMLLVKILITYDPEDAKRVRDFALATLPETAPYTSCLDIINFFQEGKSHMVLVSDFPGQDKGALGVVTLEDVIEELIGEEIIDESDVFVDVHKAIRRMAPAPKTRFGAMQFAAVEHVLSDGEDESKEPDENQPLLGNGNTSKRPSLVNGQTTFLMRRKSSTASEATRDANAPKPLAVRSSATDMKEHLKHLGPSNAASHPRSTKYTSVKIKPGVGTIPENQATTKGTDPPATPSPLSQPPAVVNGTEDDFADNASIRSGKVASDGVVAIYGTMGTVSPKQSRRSSNPKMSAQEASQLAMDKAVAPSANDKPRTHDYPDADADNERESEPIPQPDKLVVGDTPDNDDDTVGELTATSTNTARPRKRQSARSGSITETTVDLGGMKKVVLEMTSSSESGATEDTINDRSPKIGGQTDAADDDEHEKDFANGDEGDGEGGKKRRKKRGKKKKNGGTGGGD